MFQLVSFGSVPDLSGSYMKCYSMLNTVGMTYLCSLPRLWYLSQCCFNQVSYTYVDELNNRYMFIHLFPARNITCIPVITALKHIERYNTSL